jgi:hypothetical protein
MCVAVNCMVLKEGLDLLHELNDEADMERAVHSFVVAEAFKTCSSLDGPMCIHLGIGPSGLSSVRSMLSSIGWSVEELKERMNDAQVVQVLMAWWSRGVKGFVEALRAAGALELAHQAETRLKETN